MSKRLRTQLWLEFISDLICLIVSNAISFLFFRYVYIKIYDYPIREWLSYFGLLLLSYLGIYMCFHFNIDMEHRSKINEFASVAKNSCLTYMSFAMLLLLSKNPIFNCRYLFVSAFILFMASSALERYCLKRLLTNHYSYNKSASIVGVLTVKDRADDLVTSLKEDWTKNVTGIALLDNFCEDGYFSYNRALEFNSDGKSVNVKMKKKRRFPHSVNDVPVIATDNRFMDWVRSAPLDEVYINLPYEKSDNVYEMVEEMESMGITVHINVPTLEKLLDKSSFDNINCKMHSGYPMAIFAATVHDSRKLMIKRIFDLFVGTIGCILSIPIILITAIPLLIESPGPLIFKQERVGKNGRIFHIYKLRSMYTDAEKRKAELMENNKMDGLMFKMDNDPRITKVGKFIRKYSIDELPQFFNVVKGDMSLVGTRPPTIDEFEQYESRHKRRLSMRPGITGMWQVSGRSDIQDFEEVVRLDCKYIDKWSPSLDIKLLFKTVGVVLTHKGAE